MVYEPLRQVPETLSRGSGLQSQNCFHNDTKMPCAFLTVLTCSVGAKAVMHPAGVKAVAPWCPNGLMTLNLYLKNLFYVSVLL